MLPFDCLVLITQPRTKCCISLPKTFHLPHEFQSPNVSPLAKIPISEVGRTVA